MQVPIEPEEGVFYTKPREEAEVKYFGPDGGEVEEADFFLSKSINKANKNEYYIRVAHGKPYDKDLKIRPQRKFVLVDKELFDMYIRYCKSDNKNILIDLIRIINIKGLI
jgi:hypothetical protein